MSPAGQGDNNATFLAEFRALRDHAGLDYTELAARAHYPSDVLKKAEAGPGLPGLPILAAYVRACDADVTEWEERWRRLAADADLGATAPDADAEDGGLPVRPAGASPAAKAGARVTVVPADVHDPERIKAALRAHGAREEASSDSGPAHGWAAGNGSVSGADTVNGGTTMLANGHHHRRHGTSHGSFTSDASATSWSSVTPDSASSSPAEPAALPEPADPPTSADPWESPASPEPAQAEAGAAAAGSADPSPASSSAHASAAHEARSTTQTRSSRPSGNGQLKLVALVLIVLIVCILLITVT